MATDALSYVLVANAPPAMTMLTATSPTGMQLHPVAVVPVPGAFVQTSIQP
jgi:hypothetical protein